MTDETPEVQVGFTRAEAVAMTRWSQPVEIRLHQDNEDDPVVLERRPATAPPATAPAFRMDPSTLLEILACVAFVACVYELAGKGWALGGVCLVLAAISLATQGLSPIKLSFAVTHDLRVLVVRKRLERQVRRDRADAVRERERDRRS